MLGAILGDIVGSPYEFDRNNYKHKDFHLLSESSHFTDDTVMTFAVGLHLSEDETIDLLKSAGYAFSDGSKRDWIVRYCLEHKIYNINQVNTLLFEYDQEQLGA